MAYARLQRLGTGLRHDKVGENGAKAWEIEAVQLQNVWRNNQCMPNKGGYGGAPIQSQHQNVNSTTMSNNESSEGNDSSSEDKKTSSNSNEELNIGSPGTGTASGKN